MSAPHSRPLLMALGLIASFALPVPASAIEVGARAPNIGLRDLNGRMVRISGLRGKVVIVDVWASWCEPCRQEMPALQRLYARYRSRGLRVIGVSVDRDEAAARRFIERTHVRFRNVHDPDGRTPRRYGLGTMPTSWIIDHRGIVRHVTAGYRSRDEGEMRRVVERLLDAIPSAREDTEPEVTEPDETEIAEEAEEDPDEAEAQDPTAEDEVGQEPATTADGPPPAGRSEAGRTGGLCSAAGGVGATPEGLPYPEALMACMALLLLLRPPD